MPKLVYTDKNFRDDGEFLIRKANEICAEYQAQGFDLTLRQLYYQFVARGLIPNNDKEYNRLGKVVSDARLAGRIDWDFIVDRTRFMRSVQHYGTPQEILDVAANSYRIDKWNPQPIRVEVWIEKDALLGVIEPTCRNNDVPYFSCRGYTSQTAMWDAGQRIFMRAESHEQKTVILHLGDHDPSGIDMTRDIEDRLSLFFRKDAIRSLVQDYKERELFGLDPETQKYVFKPGADVQFDLDFGYLMDRAPEVVRIALNWDQVQQYNPPPNPAKLSDARAAKYIEVYGSQSWELDALEPNVLVALIEDNIIDYQDEDLWQQQVEIEDNEREQIAELARNYGQAS